MNVQYTGISIGFASFPDYLFGDTLVPNPAQPFSPLSEQTSLLAVATVVVGLPDLEHGCAE